MNTIETAIAAVLPDVFDDTKSPRTEQTAPTIPSGTRNATLASYAGSMRRVGMTPSEIEHALTVINQRRCDPPLPDRELGAIVESICRYAPSGAVSTVGDHPQVPQLVGLTLPQLSTHVFPERKALFMRGDTVVFRAGHLGQIYAERGFGKTWVLQTLALIAASGSEALGFRAPEPCRVLIIDGEMASLEIQDRLELLSDRLQLQEGENG